MGQAARRQTVEQSLRERAPERAKQVMRASSSNAALFAAAAAAATVLLPAPVCVYRYACVCVLECALRAKLIFLFIKKKSKYICIFVCCAATPSHTLPPRALNIIFVSAAKNIIYVLFMIFRFPLAFNFLLFASFDGFLVRVFIETCLIYTQRHLGTHSETPRKRTRTPRCGHTQRTVPGLGQRVFTYAQSRSQFDTIAIPTRIRIRIQIQIQRVIMSIIISAVRHNWRAAFTAYFSGFFFFFVFSIYLHMILNNTRGTFAHQFSVIIFTHASFIFIDFSVENSPKKLKSLCWLRRVASVWNFVC